MKTTAKPQPQISIGCSLLLILFGAASIGGFLWAKNHRDKQAKEVAQKVFEFAWENAVGPITADQLCQKYEDNPLTLEDGKGKVAFIVSGPINRIAVDSSGAVTVAIGGGLLGGGGCTLEPDEKEAIAKLGKGKKITVKGIMGGRDFTGQVQLTRCRLMPQEGK